MRGGGCRRWCAPSRPPPAVSVDTPLVETSFSPEELPNGEKEATYYRLTIPPGASLPYLGGLFCKCSSEHISAGVGAEVVQAGEYTLRLEAPLRVQREGSDRPSEEIPAGREVTLAAGDAVIYPDYAAPGEIRNTGNEPVTLIGVAIIATEELGTPLPPLPPDVRATLLTYASARDWEVLAPGPINVALRRMTLQPEASIGPYAPVGLQAMQVESGAIARNFLPAGETTPRGIPLTHMAGTHIALSASHGCTRDPRQHRQGAGGDARADHRAGHRAACKASRPDLRPHGRYGGGCSVSR